jgi:hypothetical protein
VIDPHLISSRHALAGKEVALPRLTPLTLRESAGKAVGLPRLTLLTLRDSAGREVGLPRLILRASAGRELAVAPRLEVALDLHYSQLLSPARLAAHH